MGNYPVRELIRKGIINKNSLYRGLCAPLNPASKFFLFVAMQKERTLNKKEKHAGQKQSLSSTLSRVNSLRSNSTRLDVVSLSDCSCCFASHPIPPRLGEGIERFLLPLRSHFPTYLLPSSPTRGRLGWGIIP